MRTINFKYVLWSILHHVRCTAACVCACETSSVQLRIWPVEEKSSFCHYPKIKLCACVKTEIRHQLAQERNPILIVSTKWQAELWSCFLELVFFFSILQCAPEDTTEHYFSAAIWDPSSSDTANQFFPCRSKGTVILPHLLFPGPSCQKGIWYQLPSLCCWRPSTYIGQSQEFHTYISS